MNHEIAGGVRQVSFAPSELILPVPRFPRLTPWAVLFRHFVAKAIFHCKGSAVSDNSHSKSGRIVALTPCASLIRSSCRVGLEASPKPQRGARIQPTAPAV